METAEIRQMRAEGEELLADLSQDEATQAFLSRSQEVVAQNKSDATDSEPPSLTLTLTLTL